MKDLGQLVDRNNAHYSDRYSEALLDELMHVGDPAADQAILALDDEAYDPDGGMLGANGRRKAFIRNLYLYLSGPDWFGTEAKPVSEPLIPLLRGASFGIGSAHRFVPGVAELMERRGAAKLEAAADMAPSHGFGVKLELDEDDEAHEASFQFLAKGVRDRFSPPAPGLSPAAGIT